MGLMQQRFNYAPCPSKSMELNLRSATFRTKFIEIKWNWDNRANRKRKLSLKVDYDKI